MPDTQGTRVRNSVNKLPMGSSLLEFSRARSLRVRTSQRREPRTATGHGEHAGFCPDSPLLPRIVVPTSATDSILARHTDRWAPEPNRSRGRHCPKGPTSQRQAQHVQSLEGRTRPRLPRGPYGGTTHGDHGESHRVLTHEGPAPTRTPAPACPTCRSRCTCRAGRTARC
jgi:hypothetical protein